MSIVYVLSEGRTASTDYYLFPFLKSLGYMPKLLDATGPPAVPVFAAESLLVISRYLPHAWRTTLAAVKQRGLRMAYFMDDDLFDLHSLQGLPWRYRWKILSQAMVRKRDLHELCDEFWVSTPYLAGKYAGLNPRLIQAAASSGLLDTAAPKVHVCYHATASHRREIGWLKTVVREVQRQAEDTHFELFGGPEVARDYRGIPRLSILHPMKWPEYLAWSGAMRRDIALAPLLSGAFNAGRGPTKFYDYARLGAAGIYTDAPPYRGFVRDGVDGVLLGSDPQEWVGAILRLAADARLRSGLAASARSRALDEGEGMNGLYDPHLLARHS